MPSKCKFINDNGEKCGKYASYALPNKALSRCATHKEPNMINPRTDKRCCIHPDHISGKSVRASFNDPTESLPKYCKAHAQPNMINFNTRNNMCKGCHKKQPSYGLLGEKATHCSKCALPDMVDVISKLCEEKGCRKNPTRGYIGEKASRCKAHALPEMIDVKNKKCVQCSKQPTFGIIKPTHCIEHKSDEMNDLKHTSERCEQCKKRASYGYGKKPTRCTEHREEEMKDVVSKMCCKCGEKQAVFGETMDKLYCKLCKKDSMKNIKAKMCEKCGEKQPVYNYKSERIGRFCCGCKKDNMVDVINPHCISCNLFMVRHPNKFCSYCSPTSTLRQKTKEMEVVNFLKEEGIDFIHNKSVGFVCGNYRPDIKIDVGTHLVIVEIDEGQHAQYDQNCELARMLNIQQAEGLNCVFLRYNPDVFKINNKAVKIHTKTRLQTLLEHVKIHMKRIPEDYMTIYRLYYNNAPVQKYDLSYEYIKMLTN